MGKMAHGAKRLGSSIANIQDAVVRKALSSRVGVVKDSVAGDVEYRMAESGPAEITILAPGLPTAVVRYSEETDVMVNNAAVKLRRGKEGFRRSTYTSVAECGPVQYQLRPTWYRRAQFRRDGTVVARARRRGRRRRWLAWQGPATPEEMTIAHALIAFAGIGAAGFVGNLLGEVIDFP